MLGQSFSFDFLAHAGLGVATASMLLVALVCQQRIQTLRTLPWAKHVFSALTGIILIAAQLAIAIFIGAAKQMRVSDDVLFGYVLGGICTISAAWFLRDKTPAPSE